MGCTEAWQRTLVPEGLVSKHQPQRLNPDLFFATYGMPEGIP
jgi:hypothetical protein